MRVPIRKPGVYTHAKPDPNLTLAKFNKLKLELEKLKKHVRPSLAAEVKRLAANGDFSENAEYQIAKGRLRGINQRILDIEDHLKRAVIIEQTNKNLVQLGCSVTVRTKDKERIYLILGSAETDPLRGVISHNSPIGSALMGKRVGDTAEVQLKDKLVEYKIIKIE